MLAKKALAAALSAKKVYVEDVFSTYLYTGSGASKTITNDIDLSGKGGLVWIKNRTIGNHHNLVDTERGATKDLYTSLTSAQGTTTDGLTSFSSTGFALGADAGGGDRVNKSGDNYVSWTFRKAKKFFDIVTYTGNGTTQAISHNLGSDPGCIIAKCTSTTGNFRVYHRSVPGTTLTLNSSGQIYANDATTWGNNTNVVDPTSTQFTIGEDINANGQTYVAYLFAHDAGGFGDAGSDSIIKCGSYTGNGSSTGPTVTLDWEPQWLLIKNASNTTSWILMDNMRGLTMGNDAYLLANTSGAEPAVTEFVNPTATGFNVSSASGGVNTNGETYIYIAIRRGPMKTPTSGTSVFSPDIGANVTSGSPLAYEAGFPVDLIIDSTRTAPESTFIDRLRGGNQFIQATNANAESGGALRLFDNMTGVKFNGTNNFSGDIGWQFRRAPGFFDVVCYTGTGSARTVTHNLGAVPGLYIIKNRGSATSWLVGGNVFSDPTGDYLVLSATNAKDNGAQWNYTAPTSTTFSLATGSNINSSGVNYVAYLFGSVSGVSKVGSYTGNGSSQTINCGFTNGARFVLIKRTDSTGDWYVYDSARGIVSGNDPQLKLNSTAAEATGYDAVDPDNSGFIVNNDATNFPINVNNATYIYLAIA